MIYVALPMSAQTEKMTFSCTLTKHTWRWTYSALRYFCTSICVQILLIGGVRCGVKISLFWGGGAFNGFLMRCPFFWVAGGWIIFEVVLIFEVIVRETKIVNGSLSKLEITLKKMAMSAKK